MKRFKLIDLIGQLIIVVGCLSYLLFLNNNDTQFSFLHIYFITGGWQLLSFFIHLRINESWVNNIERNGYGKLILGIGILGLICFLLWLADIFIPLIIFLWLLSILSPVFAAWYFATGISELSSIKKKELIHLK